MPNKQEILSLIDEVIKRVQYGRNDIASAGVPNNQIEREALAGHFLTAAEQLKEIAAQVNK